jgi:hypothetical protein
MKVSRRTASGVSGQNTGDDLKKSHRPINAGLARGAAA